MKKTLAFYLAIWEVLLILFNVITLVSVGWEGQEKYTPSFWIGYVFISLSFVGQLVCAIITFGGKNMQKVFYRVSLIKKSYAGLIASFIFGGLCMLISPLTYWIGILLCAIILALNIISVIKAGAVIAEVEYVDKKVEMQKSFIKSLVVDADTLMANAKSEAVKVECKKVYEAVRYSDPMSNDALVFEDGQIALKFSELSEAVEEDNAEKVTELANEMITLVEDRNKKCRLLK